MVPMLTTSRIVVKHISPQSTLTYFICLRGRNSTTYSLCIVFPPVPELTRSLSWRKGKNDCPYPCSLVLDSSKARGMVGSCRPLMLDFFTGAQQNNLRTGPSDKVLSVAARSLLMVLPNSSACVLLSYALHTFSGLPAVGFFKIQVEPLFYIYSITDETEYTSSTGK